MLYFPILEHFIFIMEVDSGLRKLSDELLIESYFKARELNLKPRFYSDSLKQKFIVVPYIIK